MQIKNRDNIEVDDFLDIINDKLQTQLENNPFYQYFLEEIRRKSEIIIQKLTPGQEFIHRANVHIHQKHPSHVLIQQKHVPINQALVRVCVIVYSFH